MASTLTPPPTKPRQVATRPSKPLVRDEIDSLTVWVLAGAWLGAFTVVSALQPAPEPDAALPLYAAVIGFAWLGLVLVTGVGLMLRSRLALTASMIASGAFLADSIACPVSGHHSFDLWWFGQFACALALVAVTFWAMTRARGQKAASLA